MEYSPEFKKINCIAIEIVNVDIHFIKNNNIGIFYSNIVKKKLY